MKWSPPVKDILQTKQANMRPVWEEDTLLAAFFNVASIRMITIKKYLMIRFPLISDKIIACNFSNVELIKQPHVSVIFNLPKVTDSFPS